MVLPRLPILEIMIWEVFSTAAISILTNWKLVFSFKLSFILYNHVNLSFAVRSKWLLVKVQSGRLQNLPPDHHVTNHLTTYHMTHSARIRRLQTTSLLGIDNKGYTTKIKLGRANKNNSKWAHFFKNALYISRIIKKWADFSS